MDDSLFRTSDLCADGGAVTESHGSQTAACNEVFCLLVLEVLSGPHLMLTNVGYIDRFFICHIADALNDFTWVKFCILTLDIACFLLPFCGLRNPVCMIVFLDQWKKCC